MAENDIYNSKKRYEHAVATLDELLEKVTKGKRKFYCKNPENLKYFQNLIEYFEAKDLSYIRRCRVFQLMRLVVFVIEKDLKECDRRDIDKLMAYSHKSHKTVESRKTLVRDLKVVWTLFVKR